MNRICLLQATLLIGVLVPAAFPGTGRGDDSPADRGRTIGGRAAAGAPSHQPSAPDHLSPARRAATEKRREWLRKHLTANQRDRAKVATINAQLDALDDIQVDVAAARMLEQLDKINSRDKTNRAASELAQALKTREALRRAAASRSAYGRVPPAGFYPYITVLPQGASMTASAVVSPDRRHVRVNVNPFFSSIGPVDTFNYYTGETRRLPEYDTQRREPPPVTPRYDGLRTRNDRVGSGRQR